VIDYAAIAATFADGFAVQTHGWATLFDHMDKLVESLREQADRAERLTRAYPVLRLRDDALGVRLALPSVGAFGDADGTGRSLGAGLADGARRFVGGFGFVEDAVTQELAGGRILADLGAMLAGIDASLARYDTARPDMFEAHRFSDVFGLAGLGWKALQGHENQLQLWRAAFRFGAFTAFLRSVPGGEGGGEAGAGGSAAGRDDVTDSGIEAAVAGLEDKAGLTLAAVLLLPVVSTTLEVAVADGLLAVQGAMLRELQSVESQVYDLRAQIVDDWVVAFDIGTTAHYLTSAAGIVIAADNALFTSAVPLWLSSLLDGVTGMVRGVQSWVDWASAIMRVFPAVMDDLLNVDLMPWIVHNAVWDEIPNAVIPTLTLGKVALLAAGEGDSAWHDRIDRFFSVYNKYLWTRGLVNADYDRKHDHMVALREILDRVLSPTAFWWPPDASPTMALAGFPDVYAAFFGGTRRADLLGAVGRLGTELQGSMHDIGSAGAGLASGLASTAEDEMLHQTRAGAGLQLGERWRSEGALVTGLFEPLHGDLEARSTPPGALAEAFEEAASAGGIVTAAQAVPAYVGEMRRFWATRSAQREYPTSAHLLARRGRLAMVRVPRLTLNAHGWKPGDALAAETADRFRDVVHGAYREGRARMAVLAQPAAGGGSAGSVGSAPAGRPGPARARVSGGARRGR
jgi:hypothetical protein